MNQKLYRSLIESIGIAIKKSINEMARLSVQRTIDKKLWLSVASTCSRNKSTEAENIKPGKGDKDNLLNRYVAALIIMRNHVHSLKMILMILKHLNWQDISIQNQVVLLKKFKLYIIKIQENLLLIIHLQKSKLKQKIIRKTIKVLIMQQNRKHLEADYSTMMIYLETMKLIEH